MVQPQLAANLGDFLICSVLMTCGLPTGLYWWLSSIPLNVAGVLEGIPLTKEGAKPRGKRSHTLRVSKSTCIHLPRGNRGGSPCIGRQGLPSALPSPQGFFLGQVEELREDAAGPDAETRLSAWNVAHLAPAPTMQTFEGTPRQKKKLKNKKADPASPSYDNGVISFPARQAHLSSFIRQAGRSIWSCC